MKEKSAEKPYKALGSLLRHKREASHQSIAEVSGAVEIDMQILANIELGQDRPSEDVLLLLMSYFDVKDEEAKEIWELAGYDTDTTASNRDSILDKNTGSVQQVTVMPMDVRIVYTDLVHVMVSKYGVVMNFMQGAGPNGQPLAIARVGMSKEHARSIVKVLEDTLSQSEEISKPKLLPPSSSSTS